VLSEVEAGAEIAEGNGKVRAKAQEREGCRVTAHAEYHASSRNKRKQVEGDMVRSMKTITALAILAVTIIPACSVRRLALRDEFITVDGKSARRSYYQAMTFDNWRLPVFADRLQKREKRVPSSYYAVYSVDGRPDTAYHIGVVDSAMNIDMNNPLRVIYRWSEKGFSAGQIAAGRDLDATMKLDDPGPGETGFTRDRHPEKFADEFVAGTIGGAAYATSTSGGFFLGIVKGIDVTFDEVRHAGDKGKEVLLGVVRFYYDGRGRLERMAVYGPSKIDVVMAEQVYRYRGESKFPDAHSGSLHYHPSIEVRKK